MKMKISNELRSQSKQNEFVLKYSMSNIVTPQVSCSRKLEHLILTDTPFAYKTLFEVCFNAAFSLRVGTAT